MQAIREIADRLDGKVASTEAAEGTGEVNLFINTGIIRPGDYGYQPPIKDDDKLIEAKRFDDDVTEIVDVEPTNAA